MLLVTSNIHFEMCEKCNILPLNKEGAINESNQVFKLRRYRHIFSE